MSDATWKPIPGYDNYLVSDRGTIAQLKTTPQGQPYRKLLATGRNTSGHLTVALHDAQRKAHKHYVHHLVMISFVGRGEEGQVICHYDDDPANNNLSNLRWDTRRNNLIDAVRNGRYDRLLQPTN